MRLEQGMQLGFSWLLLLLLLVIMMMMIDVVRSQDDVECLREIKNSVSTSSEYLQSWDFNTSSSAAPNICNFIGVQCLHPSEIKVYSLSLPGAGLKGTFPRGLQKCSSLTGLDLSSNFLTGPIPPNLCQMLPYLVKLDLSQNNISGDIPESLSSCVYLNELRLQRNRLQGGIPGQIGLLSRLRDFNVADNRLSGGIPYTFRAFSAASFTGNEALCGAPLSAKCKNGVGGPGAASHRAVAGRTAVIAGVTAGGTLAALAVLGVCLWTALYGRPGAARRRADLEEELLDNSWLRKIKSPSAVLVSMFEQPIVKIRLSDLAAATGGFSRDSAIAMCRTGVFYKATLRDGSVLAVKKLRKSALHSGSEKHFRTEMEALAKVRHRNLVPLLGYCIAGNERMLIYKHMPNGSLYSRLHQNHDREQDEETSATVTGGAVLPPGKLDWATRLRIAVGAARGLAWLHHSCNPRLVHRGITSSSILLDEDLEPRITDFGLARLLVAGRGSRPTNNNNNNNNTNNNNNSNSNNNSSNNNSSSSTGTRDEDGFYVPPEEYSTTYSLSRAASLSSAGAAATSSATPKGDVYAFGVVLLELVTGRKPNDGNTNTGGTGTDGGGTPRGGTAGKSSNTSKSLVDWIGELFKSGHVSEAVDKCLIAEASVLAGGAGGDSSNGSTGRRREVMQVMKIACSCVLSYPKERPSMYEVYHMLRAVGEDYYPADHHGGGGSHTSLRSQQQQQHQQRSSLPHRRTQQQERQQSLSLSHLLQTQNQNQLQLQLHRDQNEDLESGGGAAAAAEFSRPISPSGLETFQEESDEKTRDCCSSSSSSSSNGGGNAVEQSGPSGVQMQRLDASS